MNKVISELVKQGVNLKTDERQPLAFGREGSYPYILTFDIEARLTFAVTNQSFPETSDLNRLVKEADKIQNVSVRGYRVEFTVKGGMTAKGTAENVVSSLRSAVSFFSQNGYVSCCEKIGVTGQFEAYVVNGIPQILSEEGFAQAAASMSVSPDKKENIVGGVVGALVGSVIGAAIIVIIGRLGYISSIGGMVMGVLTVQGYAMLGGKLTKKGIAVSVLIMLVMVYISNNTDWAFEINQQIGIDFFDAFKSVHEIVDHVNAHDTYNKNIAMLYGFTAIGAFPAIISTIKSYKAQGKAYKL